jgi:arsenite-transporting ATPase
LKKVKVVQEKTGALSSMFSGGGPSKSGDVGEDKVQVFDKRMERLETLLRSPKDTEFTVVTIPTELAVAESTRLLEALKADGILTRRVIVNQVMSRPTSSAGSADSDTLANSYLQKLRRGQQASLRELTALVGREKVPLVQVPYFDMEVRTVYGLRAISSVLFPHTAV